MATTTPRIPLLYRLFFLYIEPISALVGAYFAALQPADYLAYLAPTPASAAAVASVAPPTPTLISLFQLANLYLLFALNEHFVLANSSSLKTWRYLLFGLLVADFGHLATMVRMCEGLTGASSDGAGAELFWRFWEWNAMGWGSIGFVYAGATMRISFLLGLGLPSKGTKAAKSKRE